MRGALSARAGSRCVSEKVVLTVVFTDLVGSTELSEVVGQDASQELWRTHLALLREALSAHGGEVVKKLGDGVMAVFPSPSGAVACAVAMQQSVDAQNRRSSVPLALRVGMQIGEVTPDEGDYYGIGVVIAERLCKRAGGGQILTTDILRSVVGRGTHRYLDIGLLELKGITEPVQAVELAWEPLPEVGLPLPHALGPIGVTPFVGRAEELEKLWDVYKSALGGRQEVAFLVGEPGIGKTRLAAELGREAHGQAATVLYGRCDETGTLYQPFVEALQHFVRTATLGELRECAGLEAGELLPLIPELPHRLPYVAGPSIHDPESGRLRLFDAVASMLRRSARDRPLVLVLDDLHWADKSTVQLLRHLLRLEPFPIMVLATFRETDIDRLHPISALIADLHRERPAFVRLRLRGLDEEEVATAIERRAGHDIGGMGRALAESLRRTTDGNPFFIEQVISHLIETGGIVSDNGVWRFGTQAKEIGIPEGVNELIGRRLSRLSGSCNALLVMAAVAGAEFHIDLLEAVTGSSIDDLLDAIDEAAAARFLVEDLEVAGRFSFAHSLVREAIYGGLADTKRASLHARIAEALEIGNPEGPALIQVAHHLLASTPSGPTRAEVGRKAAEYARRAAAYATRVYSHEEAATAYSTALQALDIVGDVPPAERCEILLDLGNAHTRAHSIEDAVGVLGEAVELSGRVHDPLLFARVAVAFGEAVRTSSRRDSWIEIPVLESALERLGPDDTAERADVLTLFAERLGPFGAEPERASALARESLAVAERLGDERRILWARDVLVMNLEAFPVSEQRSVAEENVRLAERIGDFRWQARTRIRLIAALLAVGDVERVDEELPALLAVSEKSRDPRQILQSRWWPIVRLVMEGKWDDAESDAHELLETGDRYQIPRVAWPGLLFIMRRVQGRLSEIETLVRASVRRSPMAWWHAGLALTLCEEDRHDGAREELDELVAKDLDDVARDWMWPMLLGLLGQCAHELADQSLANLVYDHLLPYGQENIHAGGFYSGSAAVVLGLCATTCERWEAADEHFAVAEALDERSRAWPWLAITQLEHASMLGARRGSEDVDRACALLSSSLPRLQQFNLTRHIGKAVSLQHELSV